jgi:hypothetical protein
MRVFYSVSRRNTAFILDLTVIADRAKSHFEQALILVLTLSLGRLIKDAKFLGVSNHSMLVGYS